MISVIYGAKGSGKTKRVIDAVNETSAKASGKVVYITDDDNSLDVDPAVRFINLSEYKVNGEAQFIGFIKGMLATDFDIQNIFIDGLCRLLSKPAEKLKNVFAELDDLAKKVDFVITVSTEKLPAYLKGYSVKE